MPFFEVMTLLISSISRCLGDAERALGIGMDPDPSRDMEFLNWVPREVLSFVVAVQLNAWLILCFCRGLQTRSFTKRTATLQYRLPDGNHYSHAVATLLLSQEETESAEFGAYVNAMKHTRNEAEYALKMAVRNVVEAAGWTAGIAVATPEKTAIPGKLLMRQLEMSGALQRLQSRLMCFLKVCLCTLYFLPSRLYHLMFCI